MRRHPRAVHEPARQAHGGLHHWTVRVMKRHFHEELDPLKQSLDAFVARDTALARRVRAEDEAVDALNHQIFRELLTFTMADPTTIPRAIRLILIARFLERVADHATNIAEMVIYLVESRMVRHTLA